MKVLVICMEVGRSAVGIVNERLIFGLSKRYETYVLTDSFSPSFDLSNVKLLNNRHYYRLPSFVLNFLCFFKIATRIGNSFRLHWRITRLIQESGYYRKLDRQYCKNAVRTIQKQSVNYDLVLSVVSSNTLLSITIGDIIKKIYGYKWIVYTVDAVPTPLEWEPGPFLLQEQNEILASDLSGIDEFYAANDQMLKYEKNILKLSPDCKTGIIYNPSLFNKIQNYPCTHPMDFIICYTGTIYGKRNVHPILQALDKLLECHENIYIWFVGAGTEWSNNICLSDMQRRHIKFFPATSDLSEYYKASTCLLNIDADIDNDVFLSSKIINYLYVDRPILNITGRSSVSRLLFPNLKSIIHCDNTVLDIIEAIEQLFLNSNLSVSDRDQFIKDMNIDSVIAALNL